MPEKQGQDFNDVLREEGIEKLQKYLDPFELKLDEKYHKAKHQIRFEKNVEINEMARIGAIYADRDFTIDSWKQLIADNGFKAAEGMVRENPKLVGELKGSKFLGIKSKEREYAEKHKGAVWRGLSNLTKSIDLQIEGQELVSSLYSAHIKPLYTTDISGMDRLSIEKCYEGLLLNASVLVSDSRDFETIKDLSFKIGDDIEAYKQKAGESPPTDELARIVNRAFMKDKDSDDSRESRSQEGDRDQDRDQDRDRDYGKDRDQGRDHIRNRTLEQKAISIEKQEQALSKNLDSEKTLDENTRQTREIEMER
jgi:hypothetical protein